MSHKFPDAWPLPEPYLVELGRISTLFVGLETGVEIAISKLMGYEELLDWRSVIVTAHANMKQRIDILETLCHEFSDEYRNLDKYSEVIKKIRKAQVGRNRYLHNALSYAKEDNTVELLSVSARGTLNPQVEQISIKDLLAVSAIIHEATVDLQELITSVKHPYIWSRVG